MISIHGTSPERTMARRYDEYDVLEEACQQSAAFPSLAGRQSFRQTTTKPTTSKIQRGNNRCLTYREQSTGSTDAAAAIDHDGAERRRRRRSGREIEF